MSSFSYVRPYVNVILETFLILITTAFAAGQSTGSSEEAAVNPAVATHTGTVQRASDSTLAEPAIE